MTRPIEAVVAEAQRRLERSGRLDVTAFASAYPEYADELNEVLPVMLTLHQERRWQRAEAESRSFAVGLFSQLSAPSSPQTASPATDTLGGLFHRDRTEAGISLEEQARRTGLPSAALDALAQDRTPVTGLDNAQLKQIAARVAAPFAALVKEVRRLASLESLARQQSAMLFTRDKETSTAEEQRALLEKVREAARKPPEEQ